MSDKPEPLQIDPEACARIRALFGEKYLSMQAQFIANTQTYLRDIHGAIEAGDKTEISNIAHKMSSSVALFGLITVQVLAKTLERTAQTISLEAAAALQSQLDAAFQASIAHLPQS